MCLSTNISAPEFCFITFQKCIRLIPNELVSEIKITLCFGSRGRDKIHMGRDALLENLL